MPLNPATVCFFVPPGLKTFKLELFERVAKHIVGLGGKVIYGDFDAIINAPSEVIPVIGCSPELGDAAREWSRTGRRFVYWDRGYARRVFATWLPRGSMGGYYRWSLDHYQMSRITERPADRWNKLSTKVDAWNKRGRHLLIAEPSPTYQRFHKIEGWTEATVAKLKGLTDRPLVFRDKESKIDLRDHLRDAHAMVTHGSNAAVEAVIMGCPVFVDRSSAAALVGLTDLANIESPVYPDRNRWLTSLAYCQFDEKELVDGTLWRLIE